MLFNQTFAHTQRIPPQRQELGSMKFVEEQLLPPGRVTGDQSAGRRYRTWFTGEWDRYSPLLSICTGYAGSHLLTSEQNQGLLAGLCQAVYRVQVNLLQNAFLSSFFMIVWQDMRVSSQNVNKCEGKIWESGCQSTSKTQQVCASAP